MYSISRNCKHHWQGQPRALLRLDTHPIKESQTAKTSTKHNSRNGVDFQLKESNPGVT